MRNKKHIPLFIIVFIIVLLTACSAKPTQNQKNNLSQKSETKTEKAANTEYHPLTYSEADRESKLLEGAKKEGALSWYTTLQGPVVNSIVKKFEEKYPFIKVEVFRGSASNLVSRSVQEAKADKNLVDVLEMTSDSSMILKEQGLTVPFYSSTANNIPDNFKQKADGNLLWDVSPRASFIIYGYNKERIAPAAPPQTVEDLLKPEFKNKIGIVSTATGIRWVGAILHQMGKEKGKQYLQKLAGQNVRVEAILGDAIADLIVQGEVASSVSVFNSHMSQNKDKGSPVDFIPLSPVIANVGDVVVAKNLPHPHAAILFVDFIISNEVKEIFKSNYYYTPTDKIPFEFWTPEDDFKTAKEYNKAYEEWKSLFESVFVSKK